MSGEALQAAQAALQAGEWARARQGFEAALALEETPEALAGLGDALAWLGQNEPATRAHERAYAAFRRRGDHAQAALAAIWLYFVQRVSLGNVAASRGWLGRLSRLVAEHELAPLDGWVLLIRAHDAEDPAQAERIAAEALAAARASGDVDLELCALSEHGVTLVELGRVEEGAALLDESMAGCLAHEFESLDTVVLASCNMITCCSRAGQFARAAQWIRTAEEFTRRFGSPHMFSVCRLHYGNVLLCTGDWPGAEQALERAIEIARAGEPALRAEALAKLAELRLAQGRIDEAARLITGIEDQAAPITAALHLAHGDTAVAAALLRRRLRVIGEDRLESAELLELLVEAAGDEPAARSLEALAARSDCLLVRARADRALGRLRGARHLERALDAFARLDMPLEAARTRMLLARALSGADEPEAAIAEARLACDAFESLGAARDADAASAFLRSLGVKKAARAGARGAETLTRREQEVLELLAEGLSNRDIAARLFLTRKTVEHHVHSVLTKLGLRGRAEAAAYAVRQGSGSN